MVGSFYVQHRRKAFRSSLLNGLIVWYRLNESSGNRADAHTGGYTLTQNGTVGSATGKVGDAANFTGNASNFLSQTGSQFNFGDSTFYTALWVYPTNNSAIFEFIHGVWFDDPNNITPNRQWLVYISNTRLMSLVITSDGIFAAGNGVNVSHSSTISANQWYFVEAYHDATNNQIGVAINGGAFQTQSWSKGIFPGATTPYRLGRGAYDPAPNPFNGRVDEVAVWNRILTTAERSTLYNSGNGIGYPG